MTGPPAEPSPAASGASIFLLTGGTTPEGGKVPTTEIYPETGGCSVPSLRFPRHYHVTFLTAGTNPMIASCGGYGGSNTKSTCEVYNTHTRQWEEDKLGNLVTGRADHSGVTLPNIGVYLIGGNGNGKDSQMTTEFLPACSTEWQAGPTLDVVTVNSCAVTISSTSFLLIWKKVIRQYDASIAGPTSNLGWLEESKWPNLQSNREQWPGCVLLNGKVVISGGGGYSTEILDITTRTIAQAGNMAKARRFFHTATFNLTLTESMTVALGGYDGRQISSVEKWNPDTETWSLETELKEPRGFFGLVALPREMICPNYTGAFIREELKKSKNKIFFWFCKV